MQDGEIEENIGELKADVVLRRCLSSTIAYAAVPCAFCTEVDGDFAGQPYELGNVLLDSFDAAAVRLEDGDGGGAEVVNSGKVFSESVWMLLCVVVDDVRP